MFISLFLQFVLLTPIFAGGIGVSLKAQIPLTGAPDSGLMTMVVSDGKYWAVCIYPLQNVMWYTHPPDILASFGFALPSNYEATTPCSKDDPTFDFTLRPAVLSQDPTAFQLVLSHTITKQGRPGVFVNNGSYEFTLGLSNSMYEAHTVPNPATGQNESWGYVSVNIFVTTKQFSAPAGWLSSDVM